MSLDKYLEIENKIKYVFNDKKLLKNAMMHSSYANENNYSKIDNNERLEFLGDAVLEVSVSEYLYKNYTDVNEGELTKLRASMVCEPTLFLCAKDIDLPSCILLGKGEEATGGRERASIVSDAMEALIGAIYLDGGLDKAKEFVHNYILNDIDNKKLFYDSKTILQEIAQGEHLGAISYELVGEVGPDHNKVFQVVLRVGESISTTGEGKTKKAAEQSAAYKAILEYKKHNN
ncbi:MAG: ribonuclease III [Lachnospiraceae bacterium]|nr:ribonuclease III [Lachnospiraceae bacterium]